ncbi:hypothetical protein Dimus_002759 [Dionaea muscipula]
MCCFFFFFFFSSAIGSFVAFCILEVLLNWWVELNQNVSSVVSSYILKYITCLFMAATISQRRWCKEENQKLNGNKGGQLYLSLTSPFFWFYHGQSYSKMIMMKMMMEEMACFLLHHRGGKWATSSFPDSQD